MSPSSLHSSETETFLLPNPMISSWPHLNFSTVLKMGNNSSTCQPVASHLPWFSFDFTGCSLSVSFAGSPTLKYPRHLSPIYIISSSLCHWIALWISDSSNQHLIRHIHLFVKWVSQTLLTKTELLPIPNLFLLQLPIITKCSYYGSSSCSGQNTKDWSLISLIFHI